MRGPQVKVETRKGPRWRQDIEFAGRRKAIGVLMESQAKVQAPVRAMQAEKPAISACCARTDAPPGNEGRGLKLN